MGRASTSWNLRNHVFCLTAHLLSFLAPFHFNFRALTIACVLYVVTGLFGVNLCYHRYLTHASFKVPKWLEYFFAYCGLLAAQGDPIEWVSNHRYHHKFVDTEKDPHSPISGFWFSHIGWVFHDDFFSKKHGSRNNVGDLEKQSFYRFLQMTHECHLIGLGVMLCALGGLPFLVWGMGVRLLFVYHVTFMVNSVCHMWGKQVWNTGDLSKNSWWVAILTFGEGWHNNHHAFENSARHGLEWWQVDATWYVIRFFQVLGLATDVKLPCESQKQRVALFNKAGKHKSK